MLYILSNCSPQGLFVDILRELIYNFSSFYVDVAVAILFSQLQFYTGEGAQPPPQTPPPVFRLT